MGTIGRNAAVPSVSWRTVSELAEMYLPPETPESDALLAAYGRAMMAWNTTESIVRLLLEVLAGEDGDIGKASWYAITAELGGANLETAVASLAPHVVDAAKADDIVFALKLVAILRGYRNYYAHGVSHIGDVKGEAVGRILTWSAKRTIKQYDDTVSAADFRQFARWCGEASAYIKAVIESWYPIALDGETAPPPQRPAQPPECKKSATHFRAHPR